MNSEQESRQRKGRLFKFPWAHVLVCFFFGIILLSCTREKSLDLGYFTKVGDLSLSSDGSQILFTGCGHKEYRRCTIYRFDRSAGTLYRYVPRDERIEVIGGRYASNSMWFAFVVIPITKEDKRQYDDMQVALINQDGTGYTQLTKGKGMKVGYTLSFDEKTLVYFRGKERTSGKTMASDFDLYKLDLGTNKETQLTNLSFYGVSDPYFTPDGKYVVFEGDSPLRLPHTNNIDIVKQFREGYKQKYKENIILKYPLDGSGIDKEPVPMFTFGIGSRGPIVTRDGSVWFEGISRGIRYCRRLPDGKIVELTYKDLGGTPTILPFNKGVSFDGKWMAILYEERKSTGHVLKRWIGMYNVATTERSELSVPATAENILIK
jgi:dipeptidyl aminopeptidase/acylaminoacyl peptidase